MKYWRRKTYPADANNFCQFIAQLQDGRHNHLLAYNTSVMIVDKVLDDDGCQHLLMYDGIYIAKLFSADATKIFIDGTFQVCPKITGVYQLLTVMAIRFGRVSITRKLSIVKVL